MISVEDYLWYVDEALDGMVAIVTELGDELANQRPDIPGANSPFATLTHCLGVMEYWGGHVVAGRSNERDRDAEFRASGAVGDLITRVRRAREQLVADMADLDATAPPPNPPADCPEPMTATQGGVLLHVYEELAQHRGQMEVCRDVLRARRAVARQPEADVLDEPPVDYGIDASATLAALRSDER